MEWVRQVRGDSSCSMFFPMDGQGEIHQSSMGVSDVCNIRNEWSYQKGLFRQTQFQQPNESQHTVFYGSSDACSSITLDV